MQDERKECKVKFICNVFFSMLFFFRQDSHGHSVTSDQLAEL